MHQVAWLLCLAGGLVMIVGRRPRVRSRLHLGVSVAISVVLFTSSLAVMRVGDAWLTTRECTVLIVIFLVGRAGADLLERRRHRPEPLGDDGPLT